MAYFGYRTKEVTERGHEENGLFLRNVCGQYLQVLLFYTRYTTLFSIPLNT